jgi:hypothetical protein
VFLALLWLLGCGRTEPARSELLPGGLDGSTLLDAGRPDAGPTDGGRPDAGQPVDAGTFDGGAPEPGPWTPKPCLPGVRPLERTVPIILFVVDTSCSMAEPFDTSTKGRTVKNVFDATLPSWDSTTLLGLLTYPTTTCSVLPAATLRPARGQVAQIVDTLGESGGESPLAVAITEGAQTLLPLRAANTSRHLVIVTDGFPNCNELLSPVTCICPRARCLPNDCRDDARVIERARNAAGQGLPTWVLSVDTPDAGVVGLLNDLSVAGGRARAWSLGRVHAHARDGQQLAANLREVGGRVRQCSRVSRSVPGRDEDFTVSFEGAVVPNDAANGWSWVDRENGELVFQGRACDALLRGPTGRLEARVVCPP